MKKTHKLTKIANRSFAVIIPPDYVRALKWQEHQNLIVKKIPRGILIIDALTKHKKK